MRQRLEYSFYLVAPSEDPSVDATLALMGSQGWEIRGLTARADGSTLLALQRPIGEDVALPPSDTLAATLEAPLVAPTAEALEAPSALRR